MEVPKYHKYFCPYGNQKDQKILFYSCFLFFLLSQGVQGHIWIWIFPRESFLNQPKKKKTKKKQTPKNPTQLQITYL